MVTWTEKATLRPNTSMKSTDSIRTGCRPNLQGETQREDGCSVYRQTHS